MSKRVKVEKCCCSWGLDCHDIRNEIMKLPAGDAHDLWKQPYVDVRKNETETSKKFVAAIERHLGIKGVFSKDSPTSFSALNTSTSQTMWNCSLVKAIDARRSQEHWEQHIYN